MKEKILYHFILTRFNLLLWNKDKEGDSVRTEEWLEHRFQLFAKYCLPSITNQTCKDFVWIVLFDSTTPEQYKTRIAEYTKECPQLLPVFVEPENGRYFAKIFRDEVAKTVRQQTTNSECGCRILTTYLDNDDALDIQFVEDLQSRAAHLPDGTFINYTDGFQYYTDHQYMMRIHYPRNHFISVIENGNNAELKTIYGFGSHYYIDKIKGVILGNVDNKPMWCEVIHEKNMGNDAYFLFGAKMVKGNALENFGIQKKVRYGIGLYLFRFLPRYVKTLIRRIGYRLFGRHW